LIDNAPETAWGEVGGNWGWLKAATFGQARKHRHTGMDAGIQAKDGNLMV
jgi:hypothetical protein